MTNSLRKYSLGLLLIVAGCSESALEQSRQAWLTTKSTCSSYSYAIQRSSFSGASSKTTIVVAADSPTTRTFERWHFKITPPGTTPTKIVDVQWVEEGKVVGTHDDGDPARTMDGLYDDCARNVMSQDQSKNDITFKADQRGALQECSYYPHGCQDDCTGGVVVTEFACGS